MLILENATKTFNPGTVNSKTALRELSLHVLPGDFVTVIGSNGAGKSTLFNAICGEFMLDTGSVTLDGEDVTFLPPHRRAKKIGHLFQDPMKGTAPGMTIEENLALASGRGGWFGTISKQDREFFREKLSELDMGLEDRMKQPVGLLSGGQRQALTLLMATVNPPKLLLLDEHTAALDPATAEKVTELTEKVVRESNLTCLMVTHNMQAALDMGSRTIMMDAGRIIYAPSGEQRTHLTVRDLMVLFRDKTGAALDNDRMLLQ